MISVSHLVRRFGSFTAVDDVSFELAKGDVVGFLGPNGAGKTTTMRMLTGFLPPTRGTVEIAGHNMLTESLEARRRIGYLPESVPLYREHRVEEMLSFQGRLHGLSRAERRRRIPELLDRVGMGARLRHVIGRLSKGQRQRIGLAVALLANPEVLILDEPTSGLDPLQRIEVRSLIAELAQDRTVLFSSHILPEVEAVCPRVIVLHQGRIAASGTRDELVGELGGVAHVALEVDLGAGADAEHAARALARLDGVSEVLHAAPDAADSATPADAPGDRFDAFEVRCGGDLRAAVGALAQASGWRVRELSWRRPTLEQIFSSLTLELAGARDAGAETEGTRRPDGAAEGDADASNGNGAER